MRGSSVSPVLHHPDEVSGDISGGHLESPAVKETIAGLAQRGSWEDLWRVAHSMSREVSVLFDSEGSIWVDVGTAGQVRLAPPQGARIPFRLWVHTHPWDAYWSETDLGTLAAYSRILESALVLGHDHMKRARRLGASDTGALAGDGPLSNWSSEPCLPYGADTGGGGGR